MTTTQYTLLVSINLKGGVVMEWRQDQGTKNAQLKLWPSVGEMILQIDNFFFTWQRVISSAEPGNSKGGSSTVPLTSCLTGLESAV
jgi:hypothetical protein